MQIAFCQCDQKADILHVCVCERECVCVCVCVCMCVRVCVKQSGCVRAFRMLWRAFVQSWFPRSTADRRLLDFIESEALSRVVTCVLAAWREPM